MQGLVTPENEPSGKREASRSVSRELFECEGVVPRAVESVKRLSTSRHWAQATAKAWVGLYWARGWGCIGSDKPGIPCRPKLKAP